jgi:hypothetical protein
MTSKGMLRVCFKENGKTNEVFPTINRFDLERLE